MHDKEGNQKWATMFEIVENPKQVCVGKTRERPRACIACVGHPDQK